MRKLFLFLLFTTLAIIDMAAQCPMCRQSVESSRAINTKSVGMGLNVGILMLLASVYIIVMVIGIIWYRNYRKTRIEDYA